MVLYGYRVKERIIFIDSFMFCLYLFTWAEQNISLRLPAIFLLFTENIVKLRLVPGTRGELRPVSQVKEGARKEEEVEVEERGESLENL